VIRTEPCKKIKRFIKLFESAFVAISIASINELPSDTQPGKTGTTTDD